ncbi:MAG: outer membrane beta-barrel protein [Gemmatimonadaceae bacterium]|nr:outer membrane beta-barrel protein [Gemmatimonadaceae bacterium]
MRHVPTAVLAIALLAAPVASAQSSGNGYLFGQPAVRVTLRGGYAHANAGSDVFDFTTEQLTLRKRDFSSLTGGLTVAHPFSERFDLGVDADFALARHGSEFRKFVDNSDKPILQTTEFKRTPVLVAARFNLVPAGRSVGRLAWIPAGVVPWLGAGAGATWYKFTQSGDFIDFQTNRVFRDELTSEGLALTGMGTAGADLSLSPRLALSAGARYLWAKGSLSNDFAGFERLDLSGVSATVGLTVRL